MISDIELVDKAVYRGLRDQDSCGAWERIKHMLEHYSRCREKKAEYQRTHYKNNPEKYHNHKEEKKKNDRAHMDEIKKNIERRSALIKSGDA